LRKKIFSMLLNENEQTSTWFLQKMQNKVKNQLALVYTVNVQYMEHEAGQNNSLTICSRQNNVATEPKFQDAKPRV
jgi:hypothetical protein